MSISTRYVFADKSRSRILAIRGYLQSTKTILEETEQPARPFYLESIQILDYLLDDDLDSVSKKSLADCIKDIWSRWDYTEDIERDLYDILTRTNLILKDEKDHISRDDIPDRLMADILTGVFKLNEDISSLIPHPMKDFDEVMSSETRYSVANLVLNGQDYGSDYGFYLDSEYFALDWSLTGTKLTSISERDLNSYLTETIRDYLDEDDLMKTLTMIVPIRSIREMICSMIYEKHG